MDSLEMSNNNISNIILIRISNNRNTCLGGWLFQMLSVWSVGNLLPEEALSRFVSHTKIKTNVTMTTLTLHVLLHGGFHLLLHGALLLLLMIPSCGVIYSWQPHAILIKVQDLRTVDETLVHHFDLVFKISSMQSQLWTPHHLSSREHRNLV